MWLVQHLSRTHQIAQMFMYVNKGARGFVILSTLECNGLPPSDARRSRLNAKANGTSHELPLGRGRFSVVMETCHGPLTHRRGSRPHTSRQRHPPPLHEVFRGGRTGCLELFYKVIIAAFCTSVLPAAI